MHDLVVHGNADAFRIAVVVQKRRVCALASNELVGDPIKLRSRDADPHAPFEQQKRFLHHSARRMHPLNVLSRFDRYHASSPFTISSVTASMCASPLTVNSLPCFS